MTSLSWCLTITITIITTGIGPCRLRYPFLVLSKLSELEKATKHSVALTVVVCVRVRERDVSEWQPPEKAINTTLCGVISLRAFTFNFSTVSSSVSEAFVVCRLVSSVYVYVCPDSAQFTNLFSQMLQRTTANSTLIWILSVSSACVLLVVWVCVCVCVHTKESRHARAPTPRGRQRRRWSRGKFYFIFMMKMS